MGKFTGMLLVSDYDNTFHYTEGALAGGGLAAMPPAPPRNLEAVRRWMEEGGRFTIATGRALAAFRKQAEALPVNAPVIVDNGGAIYDLAGEAYLVKRFLPDAALEHIAQAAEAFPDISVELYHQGPLLQVVHPSKWNEQHAKLTGVPYQVVDRVDPAVVPLPLTKALFATGGEALRKLRAYMAAEGWEAFYEMIFSSDHLLELTARGANKGNMSLLLKDLCGCGKMFCIGDHANDLSMLRAADRAFAPANAIEEVLTSGAAVVCHSLEGAVADVVEILERELQDCPPLAEKTVDKTGICV